MKYYGNGNKKALKLVAYNCMNPTTRFMKKKGMLMEYLLECSYRDSSIIYEEDVSEYKLKHFRKGEYYIEHRIRKELVKNLKQPPEYNDIEDIYVYKEVDKIYNTDEFMWRDNKKYGAKETTYVSGNFEFFIIAKTDGDAHIEVRYTACDNKHRNKVTISTIEVYNASTGEIKNAIEKWKEHMVSELANNSRNTNLYVA